MDCIMAPGRMAYITGKKPEGCVFCEGSAREEDLVLYEGNSCYIMMNKYPYTSGHLLVIPFRHICGMEETTAEEKLEMMELTDICVRTLKKAFSPEGFNIGMNLGKVAGAGVESHLHIHIVPRWLGDTNFTTVLGEIRVIPEDIIKTREKLSQYFPRREER
ncbi:MAG TPA: HIT domain-containing protein [Syntrophales bacterium]|nr:HIT domain-containing protein [Syntrophales bacterium]HPQ45214.1 HIT domain-containing protein [Syntrophales bacterium]